MAAEDRPDEPRRPGRRVLALAGLLMALAAIVVFAVAPGGEDGPAPGGPAAGARDPDEGAAADAIGEGDDAVPVDRAVAQLFVGGFRNARGPARGWSGVVVSDRNYVSPRQLRNLTRSLARAARGGDRPEPLIIADPGLLGDLGPPPAADLGVEADQARVRAVTRSAGRRLRRAGVDMVLAPPADLGVGGGPAELRSFSDDPARTAQLARGAVAGWGDAGVLAVPGRFPGEGAASQDPLEGPATVGLSLDELAARDLRPFAEIAPFAPAMQMSAALYAAWDGVTPATLLPEAVTLLRSRLRFDGAVMSADLVAATAATGESVGQAAIDALVAGCDLLLVTGGAAEQEAAYRAVLDAVKRGRVPRSRVLEAINRTAELRIAAP